MTLFPCFRAKNVYAAKGKLGFAIVKILKNNVHNIVLYNSNKTTLSSATVTSNLEVTVKGNLYISYYDNLHCYWSLRGNEEDMKKVVDTLQHLNVTIKFFQNVDETLPKPEEEKEKISINVQDDKKNQESDTDSSLNRKTKQSILNRMANMGHSVLPPPAVHAEKSSDSSDTNEIVNPHKPRYKAIKAISKRFTTDKSAPEAHCQVEAVKALSAGVEQSTDNLQIYTLVNGQLVPGTNTSILPTLSQSNDMNLFTTEQRISNSEMRININRTNDKLDIVLEKLKNLDSTDKSKGGSNFQIEVMQKLLNEYENKIDLYEKMLKGQDMSNTINQKPNNNETEQYKSKIAELEKVIEDKNNEIIEIKHILSQQTCEKQRIENSFQEESKHLKLCIETKDKELATISTKLEESKLNKFKDDSSEFGNQLKSIMNDTFRAVTANFENNENYSGETVKNIIASIIKQVTMQTINELNVGK